MSKKHEAWGAFRLQRRTLACLGIIGFLLTMLPSCVGPTFIVQQYGGAPRSADQIAIIRLHGNGGVELASLDHEAIEVMLAKDTRLHIEVLPGPHEAQVAAQERGLTLPLRVRFMAEAGKVYRPVVTPKLSRDGSGEPAWDVHFYEVDRSSDEEVRMADEPLSPENVRSRSIPGPDAGPTPAATTTRGDAGKD